MVTIQITIDALGNITGGDLSGRVGDQVTWQVTWQGTPGTITIGQDGQKTLPFTNLTAPGRGNNQWTANILSAGDYNISDSQGKQKSPKISIFTPKKVVS